MRRPAALALCLLLTVCGVAGCSNPDASTPAAGVAEGSPQNAGEPRAPAPPSTGAQSPSQVKATPAQALAAFSVLYTNWTYRTLAARQRQLAAISLGAARLAEQQAAVSSQADTAISRGRIWNTGQLISVTRDLASPGMWVLVTRERTGGDTEYEGLPAAYHVTLAQLAHVHGGYAVTRWLPQS